MEQITREQLKREIDALDTAYLNLAYRVLQQFPHASSPPESQHLEPQPDKISFSQRWRGKLSNGQLSPENLEADPRLAYLVERYKL